MRIFIVISLLLLSGLLLFVVASCLYGSPTPIAKERDFKIDELLVDASVFPPDWHVYEGPSAYGEDRVQKDDRYIEFRPANEEGQSMHIVFQYRDSRVAAYWYHEYLPAEFRSAFRVTPWETPGVLRYHSRVADQFRFACADFQFTNGNLKRDRRCTAMGQYGEYVSVFFTYISPDFMTYADLERILKVIDERMAHYLAKGGQ